MTSCGCLDPLVFGHRCSFGGWRQSPGPALYSRGQPMGLGGWVEAALDRERAFAATSGMIVRKEARHGDRNA